MHSLLAQPNLFIYLCNIKTAKQMQTTTIIHKDTYSQALAIVEILAANNIVAEIIPTTDDFGRRYYKVVTYK